MVQTLHKEPDIDVRYYNGLVDDAIKDISQYCDFEWFASDDADSDSVPWCVTPEESKVDISQCENCTENANCDVVSE